MKKVIFFLLFSSLTLAAQSQSRLAIHLEVAGAEQSVTSSYFRRELRSLGDVTLVDKPTEADFWLSVVVMQDHFESGRNIGYSISIAILEDSIIADVFDGEDKDIIEAFETFDLADHWLWSSAQASLRKRISEMVAEFDSKHLERRR